jgi:hypothetical protein
VVQDPRRAARNLVDRDGQALWKLWLRYWGNGGNAQLMEFDAYIHEAYECADIDLEILAFTLEELGRPQRP